MRLHLFILLLLALLMGACQPQPAPTATPAPPTATHPPQATATPLPTRAPLPTPIPTIDRTSTLPPQAQAYLRVVHAAPSIQKADVYLDAQAVAFNMDYQDASGRVDVPAGEYVMRLLPAGARSEAGSLLERAVTLEQDTNRIAVIMPDETVQFFTEPVESLATTESRLQVINTIPGSPPTTLDREDGTGVAFDPVGYGAQSPPVVFTAEDKTLDLENLLQDYEITLRPNRTHTLVLMGTPDEPLVVPFDVTVPARAALSLVNLSEAVGEVDIYLNSNKLTNALGFRAEDGLPQLPTGSYEIAVYDAGVDPERVEPLLTSNLLLNPDDEVFALLIGGSYDDLRLVTYQQESSPTATDETRIAFVHAVPGVFTLTELRNEAQNLSLTYGQPLVTTFPAETRDFEFVTDRTEDDYTIVEFIADYTFEAGSSYLVLITGQGNRGDNPLIFENVVGTESTPADPDAPQPPQAYLVNAIDRPVQVIVDGVLVENDLAPESHTDMLTLDAGRREITIANPETREPIYTANRLLQDNTRYSLVLFGDVEQENFLIAEFPIVETSNAGELSGAFVRVVNVSLDTGRNLALGYGDVLPPDGRPTNREDASNVPLPTYVAGFTSLAVPSGQVSEPIVLAPQAHDLYVYDANSRDIMAALYDVRLESEGYYEIIVTPRGTNTPYEAFMVRVP